MKNDVNDALQLLIGLRAWGLTRTYGTAFIIEFGEGLLRNNSTKIHGQSHVLVQSGAWRILDKGSVFVGSDDDTVDIDRKFYEFKYGNVASVIFNFLNFDLEISSIMEYLFRYLLCPLIFWKTLGYFTTAQPLGLSSRGLGLRLKARGSTKEEKVLDSFIWVAARRTRSPARS